RVEVGAVRIEHDRIRALGLRPPHSERFTVCEDHLPAFDQEVPTQRMAGGTVSGDHERAHRASLQAQVWIELGRVCEKRENERVRGMSIAERKVDGLDVIAIAGDIEASFVPSAGMVGCSLLHGGEELLGQRGGLAHYVSHRSTMGIPLLHPWANRLSRARFALNGGEIALDSPTVPVSLDPNGLPIHGLLAGASGWRVERHEVLEQG